MTGRFAPHDLVSGLLEAMRAAGVHPRDPGAVTAALMHGDLVRFPCEGDKGPNGWARLVSDGQTAGFFGNWKLGIKGSWRPGALADGHRALPPRPALWPVDGKGWDFADTFKTLGGVDLIRRALGMKDIPHG